jgi:DNA invertase Pin-like site-specific DNA recombinase
VSDVPLRAVALIRMSSAKQVFSPGRQRSLFADYCERWSLTPVSEYEDLATSATHVRLEDRPGIMAMLADAQKGLFEIVWCEEQSRASRDPLEIIPIQRHLTDLGVSIVDNSEDPYQKFDEAQREFTVGMRAVIARFEVRQLSARISRALRDRVAKGKRVGGPIPVGFGWDARAERFTLDEATADLPRRAFSLFLDCCGNLNETTRRLAAEGFAGPRGGLLSYNTVEKILRCPWYRGIRPWAGEAFTPDLPGVVSPQTIHDVDLLLASRDSRPQRAVHARALFAGMLRCPSCGAWLTARYKRSGYASYRCSRHWRAVTVCENRRTIAQNRIETFILPRLAEEAARLLEMPMAEKAAKTQPRKKEAVRLELSRQRARSLYVDGLISRDELEAELRRVEKAGETNRPRSPRPGVSQEQKRTVIAALGDHWSRWSLESKRELLLALVESITPNPEDMEASVIEWRMGV